MERSLTPMSSSNDMAASPQEIGPVDSPDLSRWTFLTNHAHVLALISRHPQIVLRQVAARIGITERAVQRIILELEQGGFIVREKVGRQNFYQVKGDKPLRHPVQVDCVVQDLLDLIARQDSSTS
jgi:predicted ArsR family transcriptional regulator